MSIGAYLDCDWCGVAPIAGSTDGGFRRRLRATAREYGWTRVKSDEGTMIDLCPACSEELERLRTPAPEPRP